MKHSTQAKADTINALKNLVGLGLCVRACLLVDLDGRIRVLLDLKDTLDQVAAESQARPALVTAAEVFWTDQIWFDRDNSHPLGRLLPSERALYEAVWHQGKPAEPSSTQVFLLTRRYSKETWFSDTTEVWPLIIDGSGKVKTPPIVSFYSFKGGVGRTTALASFAIQNARAGRKVLILDLDLEAPGIGSVFPPSGAPTEVGLLDYLIEQPVAGQSFDPLETVYIFDDKPVTGDGEIHIVPAGRIDEHYLEKLARLDYMRLSHLDSSNDPPVHDLLRKLKASLKPDLVLLDSRAGLDDIGGLALSQLAHLHVVVGTDSPQSWEGMTLAVDHLGRQKLLEGRKQLDCLIVQAHVNPMNSEPSKESFRQKSYEVFSNHYYDAASNTNAEWPLPDELATEEPHYPLAIVHDTKLLGYSSVTNVAEYLCDSDYRHLAQRLNSVIGFT